MGGDNDEAYFTVESVFRTTDCGWVPRLDTFHVKDCWVLSLPTWECPSAHNKLTETWDSTGLFSIFPPSNVPIGSVCSVVPNLRSHQQSRLYR